MKENTFPPENKHFILNKDDLQLFQVIKHSLYRTATDKASNLVICYLLLKYAI